MKKDFLISNGFRYDANENGYIKEVNEKISDKVTCVGFIVVNVYKVGIGNTPLFMPNKHYYCLPTLEMVNNQLDYYENKLTDIEIERVSNL